VRTAARCGRREAPASIKGSFSKIPLSIKGLNLSILLFI
jgi:hypothetical protein